MSERKRQREHHAYIWGAILLFLGVVFLLQNLDVLPWGLWGTLWRFWPVLIIILGINILFRHRHPWLVSILVLLLLSVCLGIAVWQYSSSSPIKGTTGSYAPPLDRLEKAQIEIDFNGAARLKIDADLSAAEVNQRRFPKSGAYYASTGFESAEKRVELELDCDVSRGQVK